MFVNQPGSEKTYSLTNPVLRGNFQLERLVDRQHDIAILATDGSRQNMKLSLHISSKLRK